MAIIVSAVLIGVLIGLIAVSCWRIGQAIDRRSQIAVTPFLISQSDLEDGLEIVNFGSGPALNIYWKASGDQDNGFIAAIAPGRSARIANSSERLEVRFESLLGQKHAAVLHRDGATQLVITARSTLPEVVSPDASTLAEG